MISIDKIVIFIKLMILFMSLLNIIKDVFKLLVSVKKQEKLSMPKNGLLFLGLSVSYVLTMFFMLFL